MKYLESTRASVDCIFKNLVSDFSGKTVFLGQSKHCDDVTLSKSTRQDFPSCRHQLICVSMLGIYTIIGYCVLENMILKVDLIYKI